MSETDKGSCLCFGSLFFCTNNRCPAPDGPRQNGQEEKTMYDVAIIGCGVIGAAAAYALSRYDNKVVIL